MHLKAVQRKSVLPEERIFPSNIFQAKDHLHSISWLHQSKSTSSKSLRLVLECQLHHKLLQCNVKLTFKFLKRQKYHTSCPWSTKLLRNVPIQVFRQQRICSSLLLRHGLHDSLQFYSQAYPHLLRSHQCSCLQL